MNPCAIIYSQCSGCISCCNMNKETLVGRNNIINTVSLEYLRCLSHILRNFQLPGSRYKLQDQYFLLFLTIRFHQLTSQSTEDG